MKLQRVASFVGLWKWLPALLVAFLASCNADREVVDAPEAPKSNVDLNQLSLATGMLRGGDHVPIPEPAGEPSEGGEVIPSIRDGLKGVIISRSTMYNAGVVYNEYLLFNPMSNLIYPGNVLVGNSISNGRYLSVRGQKIGDITWSTPDLIPASKEDRFVRTIGEPQFSDFAATMQAWRATPQLTPPAITTFEMTEVKDLREFSAKFGIGFESEVAKAGLSFESRKGMLKTHILVKFVQKLFTVSMDIPNRQLLLDAAPDAFDGVMPVYISDVFYGRIGYALISTDHDYLELLAALQVMVPPVNVELSAGYKKILDESFTQYIFIGGRSGDHGLSVKDGWEGFRKAISAELHPSDAVPVAITLRYPDDHSVARVIQTGQYPVTESYFVKDCEEMKFTLRPVQLNASAGIKEELQVWGHVKLTVPEELSGKANGPVEYPLLSVPMNQYIKLDKQKQAGLPSQGSMTVTLKRPEGMSMKEFMNQRVFIDTQFHNTNAAGTYIGDDLGASNYSIRIQDLLFNSIHNSLVVTTRKNARRDYSATVLFDLFHDAKEIEEVPNTLRSAYLNDGSNTQTRSYGGRPETYFNVH
ncbi:MAG: thiol-activated cytolysin family protein [Porphyromonas sp.]|nr:thiol-activated cytolysin family protein [Porphyromonas sp.]